MVIKFACPNGHPLSAGDEFAGKPGKCPKCQAMFLVPDAPAPAPLAESQPAPTPGVETTIAFLCPNDHRLTGPRSLQGKAGQCPHCGSKFRIPVFDAPEPPIDEAIPVGEMVEHSEDGDEGEVLQDVEVIDDEEIIDDVEWEEEADLSPPPPPTEGAHPLAALCAQMRNFGKGGVEVTFRDGAALDAEFFAPELSRISYGVFIKRNEAGAYTVVAARWEEVIRLSFGNVTELPKDLV